MCQAPHTDRMQYAFSPKGYFMNLLLWHEEKHSSADISQAGDKKKKADCTLKTKGDSWYDPVLFSPAEV